jgi:hypothetical protein
VKENKKSMPGHACLQTGECKTWHPFHMARGKQKAYSDHGAGLVPAITGRFSTLHFFWKGERSL